MVLAYGNPYYDTNVLEFLWTFLVRLGGMVTGSIRLVDLAADEVQIFCLIGIGFSSAIVGTFLMLRRMTMLANALSHTILLGIVLAYVMAGSGYFAKPEGTALPITAMLFASLIMGLLTTFLTELFTKVMRLQEDASVGIVFTSLFALGVVAVTMLTRSTHLGLEAVMGNVDALYVGDLKLVYLIVLFNGLIVILFYKELKITTFDPALARTLGISTVFFNYLLMTQVSATAIGAFRAVGVLMLLTLITGPVLTARLFTKDLKTLIALSAVIGVVVSVVGVAISRHLLTVYGTALSTGGVVVCLLIVVYVLAIVLSRWRSRRSLPLTTSPQQTGGDGLRL